MNKYCFTNFYRDQEPLLEQRQPFHQLIQNWSHQYCCVPQHIYYPTEAKAVESAIRSAVQRKLRVRVFGSGHSPSDIAMSDEALIVTTQLNRILSVDRSTKVVSVQAGITLKDLNQALASHGLALPNLGSISDQTLAGAMATATHGTGLNYGVLPSIIRSMTLITATGESVHLSEYDNVHWFKAAQCSLGSLGVFTEFELQVCDAFDLEVFEQPNDLETVLEQLPNRLQADHYRFWYLPHSDLVWEWSAIRQPPGRAQPTLTPLNRIRRWYKEHLIGYHLMELLLYLATFRPSWIPAINRWYTQQEFGTSRQSCGDSVSQFNFNCLFKQYVNEWCIPIQHTADGILKIREMLCKQGYYVHLPIEVRFVKGDDIWLSPCQGQDSCYIGIIAYLPYEKPTDYQAYFKEYEQIMQHLGGRPHWAKCFGPDHHWLKLRYPYWNDFQAVRTALDPNHYFSNSYTDRVLG